MGSIEERVFNVKKSMMCQKKGHDIKEDVLLRRGRPWMPSEKQRPRTPTEPQPRTLYRGSYGVLRAWLTLSEGRRMDMSLDETLFLF